MLVDAPVLDMLSRYRKHGGERWHTPGHKGVTPVHGEFLDWANDITEIEDMHATPNPVELSERLMASAYGADRTWYSVQGATLPVMAGILAAFPFGSTLLIDRAIHRSVLGALIIGAYKVRWLYPDFIGAGLPLPLKNFPSDLSGVDGVVLTRPTYDGLAAPLTEIVQAAHQQGLIVVVDEAHGSHWQGPHYPASALAIGADLVAHGVHKNEASLTQTGLLHLKGHRVSASAVERWWRVLQTTSPSYLLLGALDRLQWERRQPERCQTWDSLAVRARDLWIQCAQSRIALLQPWAAARHWEVDPARLTIMGQGLRVAQVLAPVGAVEKVTAHSCTLILSPQQSLAPLASALARLPDTHDPKALRVLSYPRLKAAMGVREAFEKPGHWVPLAHAAGEVAHDPLVPYPPGIPAAMPGELLTPELTQWLSEWVQEAAGTLQGIKRLDGQLCVWVVRS
ncbi:MAG: arginine decarboxylase [Sulfobacillus acidophilus]|uniref:Arginine decarboxylase n=1 Tax=Sulfobacillus acidophilus TaxID=53633 RepID=A0A2T2WH93_9FIRM|nr:MAG: arginine decarboxylase [Sulfobacillus acidophilus]